MPVSVRDRLNPDVRIGLLAFSAALDRLRADATVDGVGWLRVAADHGVPAAATLAGQLLFGYAPELSLRYLRMAEPKDPRATYLLGIIAFRGTPGCSPDASLARKLLRNAADRGNADAMFEYSLMMLWGHGGPEDEDEARHWEQRAAEAGSARACLNRGARASSETDEPAHVVAWYRSAAEAGSAEAAARLCRMFATGDRVAVDDELSRYWFAYAKTLGYNWSR